jgi:hypothetical protein
MPAELTFTQLQANLVSYLERGSSLDPIVNSMLPTLINQAERRISREIKVLGFVRTVQSSFSIGVWTLAKPDRWRETVSWNYGSTTNAAGTPNAIWTPIFPRSLEYVRNYNRDISVPNPPKFFADYDYQHWCVAPTPDQNYPFEILYYEMPALLDATNGTNWLTAYVPELLTYASLLECEPFLKNDERIPVWQAMFDRTLAAVNKEDPRRIIDRQVTRQEA